MNAVLFLNCLMLMFPQKIRRFDVSKGAAGDCPTEPVETLEGHNSAVKYVRLLADGKRLLSIGDDRTVRVWDPVAGEGGGLIKTIELPTQPHSLEMTSTGDRFVMALGNKVQVWSTNSFEMIKVGWREILNFHRHMGG